MAFDQTFGASIAAKGASQAHASVMDEAGRLNRRGAQPMPRAEGVAWLAREVSGTSSEPMKAETAQSGDLGYTWGRYSAKGPTATVTGNYRVTVCDCTPSTCGFRTVAMNE